MSESEEDKIGQSQMHAPDQIGKGLAPTMISNGTNGPDNDTAFSIGTSLHELARYTPANDLLDTLTKQQLIQRCRWEIKLKEQVGVQKGAVGEN
jgi:hypothetical protein